MKAHMLDWYDCLPPWFPHYAGLTCEIAKSIIPPDNTKIGELTGESYKLVKEFDLGIYSACLPPCITMTIRLKEMLHVNNRQEESYVQLKMKETINKQTDVYSYDEFSLVVDLGSALGLWLGLSALSIFDSFIDIFCSVRTRYFY